MTPRPPAPTTLTDVSTASCRRNRLGAWLALAAMLALALVPTLSRALGSAPAGDAWAVVCSAEGTGRAAGEGTAGTADPAAHLDRCLLCVLSAAGAALGPPRAASSGLPMRADEAPRGQVRGPHTRHAAQAAQPRGPPSRA